MSQVPTVNVSALYANSTVGEDISPTIFDAAVQDIIATINANDNFVQSLVPDSPLTPVPPDFMARQAMINGNFDVTQRGRTFTNPANADYTLDRYQVSSGVDGGTFPTAVHSQLTLSTGDIANSYYGYRVNVNGAGVGLGPNSFYWFRQKIEHGVRYLCGSGKKVTVSFWAKSDIPNKKIGLHIQQYYGSGGTPTVLETINGTKFTLTATWTKYTFTFDTNTLAGKTFGTNNDDYLIVNFMYQWGLNYAARAGDTAVESFVGAGNIDIAQLQVCSVEKAAPFQPRKFADELILCKRYYQKSFVYGVAPAQNVGGLDSFPVALQGVGAGVQSLCVFHHYFGIPMRTAPTITTYNPSAANAQIRNYITNTDFTSTTVGNVTEQRFRIIGISPTGSSAADVVGVHWAADAEL